MIHQLPTDAQITDGDHVRIDRILRDYRGGESVEVMVTYGTKDADGNFVERAGGPTEDVRIGDVSGFDAASSTASETPAKKRKSGKQFRDDVLDWLDSKDADDTHNDGWPRF